jgi:DNA-binding transcriptional LysR family regulator
MAGQPVRLRRAQLELPVDMAQAEAFLTLAEELHFGRTAQRLRVSQPRVSRLIASLERQAGGRLFERTSRKVTLTPLGEQLHTELRPGYDQMHTALDHARCTARETAGLLRLGTLVTLAGPGLTRLIEEFSARCPGCQLSLHTVVTRDPYGPLRREDIDVLVSYLVVDEPDLTAGPAFEYRDRILLVARGHRLAGKESVSVEDLADEEVPDNAPTFPAALFDAISPPVTPSGRPIRRTYPWTDDEEVLTAIARGRIVKPGNAGIPLTTRPDFVPIPIRDLPPMPVGLIWRTAHDNARIRALAAAARAIYQPPARRNRRRGGRAARGI